MKPQVPEGMTAEYKHIRLFEYRSRDSPKPTGGTTYCLLRFAGEVDPVAVGEARCSAHDCYNKRIGRHISLGRALKVLREINERSELSRRLNTPIEATDLTPLAEHRYVDVHKAE